MSEIKKICVIGAGMMGAAIAATAANGGFRVLLLDLNIEVAKRNFDSLKKQRPPAFSLLEYASRIEIASLETDLNKIKDCDLIIEAIIEKLDAKHDLYNKISPYLKPESLLASNTSTLQLYKLKEKLPAALQDRFCIVHFFNPPRYMQLIELVTGTLSEARVAKLERALHDGFGKTIIKVNDQPGFIVNRLCCFLLEVTVRKAIEMKLSCHKIDQIFCKYLGFPRTGIFGLYDLIGHDVMHLIAQSFWQSLPADDRYNLLCQDDATLASLRQKGFMGRKSGGGFYKMEKQDGRKELLELDLNSLEYHKVNSNKLPESLGDFLREDDEYARLVKESLAEFFTYSHYIIPGVTDQPSDVDAALRLGNNLKMGPFDLLSNMPQGNRWLAENSHLPLPKNHDIYKPKNNINDSKKGLIKEVVGAYYYNIDKGYVFVLDSKMNCLTEEVFDLLAETIDVASEQDSRLVLHSTREYFSAGANLNYFYDLAQQKEFRRLDAHLAKVQAILRRLKYSSAPVISAARGFALGGGCEILLHSNYIVGHQNLSSGLVELGVGLVPAYGGTTEMLLRLASDNQTMQPLYNILLQNKSQSADQFLQDYSANGQVIMHKEGLLEAALNLPLSSINMADAPKTITIPKNILLELAAFTPEDEMQEVALQWLLDICHQVQISVDDSLAKEREMFLSLFKTELSLKLMNRVIHRQ